MSSTADTTSEGAAAPPALWREIGLDRQDLQVALRVARGQAEQANFTDALRSYSAIMMCDPEDVDAQVGFAGCAIELDLFEAALQAAAIVMASAPADPRGHLLSGLACRGLGLDDEARRDFVEAERAAEAAGMAALAAEAGRRLAALDARSEARPVPA